MLRGPSVTAQALAAEGVRPTPPPPPPMAQFYADFQPPPPPPPPSGRVALAYPTALPQALGPGGQNAYAAFANPPAPPPGRSPARAAVQNLVHTAGHAAASSAGQMLGTAAAAALLARTAGLGARMGVEGGPAGVLVGAMAGTAAGVGQLAIHGLMNRGGSGGSSDPAPVAAGAISGFRPQGRNINQGNIAAQQRAHVNAGGPAAFTGNVLTLNGMNENHRGRDHQPTPIRTVDAPTVMPAAPVAATVAPTAAPSSAPARSGVDVYREMISQMADAEDDPRVRTPRRGDRRPLGVQRAEQERAAMSSWEVATSSRDQTIPVRPAFKARPSAMARAKPGAKPGPPVTVAASSSGAPPPPPGAGAVRTQVFDIAKTPRPQTATRPVVPQRPMSGKRKAVKQAVRPGPRPPQPPPPAIPPPAIPPPARNRKRAGAPAVEIQPAPNRKRPGEIPAVEIQPPHKRVKLEPPPTRTKRSSNWKQTKSIWGKVR